MGTVPFRLIYMTTNAAAILSEYDIIIVGDKSGSMAEPVKNGSKVTRWESMQESMLSLARETDKIDADGIDVVFFGGNDASGIITHSGVTADKIKEAFTTVSPRGRTPLAEALTAALGLAGKSAKKDLIVVFTDGVPNDEAAAAKVIVDASNQQDTDDALTILFVQVGDDAAATAYLRGLDDNLKGAKFDIVDVKTIDEADAFPSAAELLVAAIND